jgi:hypothetical protein
MGYNHYVGRLGMRLPETAALLARSWPEWQVRMLQSCTVEDQRHGLFGDQTVDVQKMGLLVISVVQSVVGCPGQACCDHVARVSCAGLSGCSELH